MSYKKILELANKFAQKTSALDQAQERLFQQGKIQEFFEQFKRHLRSYINEMDGDHMSLRIMGYPRPKLKEFSILHQGLIEKANKLNDQQPLESIQETVDFIFAKSTRILINSLEESIQYFLKHNQVDYAPGTGFTHVRVESLRNVIALVTQAQEFLNSQSTDTSITGLNQKEIYNPAYNQQGGTKVDYRK